MMTTFCCSSLLIFPKRNGTVAMAAKRKGMRRVSRMNDFLLTRVVYSRKMMMRVLFMVGFAYGLNKNIVHAGHGF